MRITHSLEHDNSGDDPLHTNAITEGTDYFTHPGEHDDNGQRMVHIGDDIMGCADTSRNNSHCPHSITCDCETQAEAKIRENAHDNEPLPETDV